MGITRLLLWVTLILLLAGTLARWHSDRRVGRAAMLVDRSRDASLAFVASLDDHHGQAELLLLDARRAALLSAARWRATGWLAWAVALVALLGAWVGRALIGIEADLSTQAARHPAQWVDPPGPPP